MTRTTLAQQVETLCQAAFAASGFDASLGAIKTSDRPDLADFQCNGLLAAAKQYKVNPRAAAQEMLAKFEGNGLAEVSIAGPGFLNFRILPDAMLAQAVAHSADDRSLVPTAAPQQFLLDYGGPNVAKEMHVGHLRSSIVGQALHDILAFAGHKTAGDVHLGDWGLQLGLLITLIEEEQAHLLEDPDNAPLTMEDLQAWYPAASARSKEDAAFLDRARSTTQAMQTRQGAYYAMWKRIVDVSSVALQRDFARLGVSFDFWYGESRYQAALDGLVIQLMDKGDAVVDDGAVIIRLPEDAGDIPPLMLRNSKGGYGYGATDLATIDERTGENRPDAVLYVVDARQRTHFQQVFAAAHKTGLDRGTALEHIAFGTVNGPDGKPFKTRAGGVMRLSELMDMMHDAAKARLSEGSELTGDALDKTAEEIAVGAVKFGELSHDRESNYIFDMEQFLRFEGKTGPYLQYTAVRIRSLFARAAAAGVTPGDITELGDNARELILCADDLPAQLARTIDARKPSVLAMHLYALANRMNQFYTANKVLADDVSPAQAAARLGLLKMAESQLVMGLGILGIPVPDRM